MNSALDLHPKTAGASLSGSLTLIILWVLSLWHVTVPPEVAAGGTVIMAALGAYFAPLAAHEQAVLEGEPTPEVAA